MEGASIEAGWVSGETVDISHYHFGVQRDNTVKKLSACLL